MRSGVGDLAKAVVPMYPPDSPGLSDAGEVSWTRPLTSPTLASSVDRAVGVQVVQDGVQPQAADRFEIDVASTADRPDR